MLTTEDVGKYNAYPYHCLMRPPMPGAIPMDGLSFVDFRCGKTANGHHHWGTAVYKRQLSQEEIDQYEMEPTTFCVCD